MTEHDEWVDGGGCDALDDDGSWCSQRVDHDGVHQPVRPVEDQLEA